MNKFLVKPKAEVYAPDQFDGFLEALNTADQYTVQVPINHPEDLLLDDAGCLVESGFRLSPLAFKQICMFVAKGLWPLIMDIGGVTRGSRSFDGVISPALAARIFNDCVQLRFRVKDGICGRLLIQNHNTKVIDGVVGVRYQYLANHLLLDGASDLLATHSVPMEFWGGTLTGRRMSVTFLAPEALATTPAGQDLYGGCYVTNSEAGECGVRSSLLLQYDDTPLRCISKLHSITHVGKSFMKRLQRMVMKVLHDWDGIVDVVNDIEHLATTLDVLDDTGKIKRTWQRRVATRLSNYVDKGLADAMIRQAIYTDVRDDPLKERMRRVAERTVEDFFVVIMEHADGQYPEVRESLERAAYDVLAKRIPL